MTEIAAPDAIEYARRFHARGVWAVAPFDEAAVTATFERMRESDDAYLEASGGGLIGGVLMPLWFSPDVKVAAELFWFSEKPGRGAELRANFERWARSRGASYVQFSSMANDREIGMRRLFGRAGYQPVETGFRKAL